VSAVEAAAPPLARTVTFSTCELHGTHEPVPLVAELHHLQAKAYGITELALEKDPRFDQTLATICPTGHLNVHELIRRLLAGMKLPAHNGSKTTRMALYAVAKYTAASGR